jgi:hypothetical protein
LRPPGTSRLEYCPGQLNRCRPQDFQPATHYQVGIHFSLKEKMRFDWCASFVSFLLQSPT